jgi:hypothetical protein
MKYLNKFNEGFGQNLDEQELREFCEMYLAYLIDEGFEVDISKIRENLITDYWKVKFFKLESKGDLTYSRMEFDKFKWNSIKDQFIPFFKILNDKYIIKKNYAYTVALQMLNGNRTWATNDNILNDDFSKNFKRSPLLYIEIMLYSEK